MSISAIIFLLLLSVLPFLDAGRSALADLIIFISPLLVVFSLWPRRKTLNVSKVQMYVGVLALISVILLTISTANSVSVIESIYDLFRNLSIHLMVFLGFWVLKNQLNLLSLLVSVVGTILSLISFYFLLPNIIPPAADFTLFYASYGHNHLAAYLLISLPITLGLFTKYRSKLFALVLCLQFLAFLLTFSRSAWIIFLLLSSFFIIRLKPSRAIKLAVLLASMFIAIVFFFSIRNSLHYVYNPSSQTVWERITNKQINLAPRLVYFRESLSAAARRPLTGWGPDTFTYSPADRLSQKNQTSFAHNFFLQVVYETGFFNLFVVGFFIFVMYFSAFRHLRTPLEKYAFVGALMSLLLSQVDFDWHSPAIFLTALLLLVAMIASGDKTTVKSKSIYFVVLSLSLLPLLFIIFATSTQSFNRTYFRRRISEFDIQNRFDLSDQALQNWYRLDHGNSQMYDLRAERQIRLGNYRGALTEHLNAYSAPFNSSSFNMELTDRFFDHYLSSENQLSAIKMTTLLRTVSEAYEPHDFFSYQPWQRVDKIGEVVEKILGDEQYPTFSDDTKGRLNYWKYTFLIWSNQQNFADYQYFIDTAVELDPENAHYRRVALINDLLVYPSQEEILQQINLIRSSKFGFTETPEIYLRLLKYLEDIPN